MVAACEVCWTVSWTPCKEDTPNAVTCAVPRVWVVCQMCEANGRVKKLTERAERAEAELAKLTPLAGKLLSDANHDGEWCSLEYDGCDIEGMFVKAGLIEQLQVDKPCRKDGCVCDSIGFPTTCNRLTDLGDRCVKAARE